jgi:hypothetical protein
MRYRRLLWSLSDSHATEMIAVLRKLWWFSPFVKDVHFPKELVRSAAAKVSIFKHPNR